MKELQELVRRFFAREVGIAELQEQFARLLRADPELATPAAAWLNAAEKDGRFSEVLCSSLKNVLVMHLAASNLGPDPSESGVFDVADRSDIDASTSDSTMPDPGTLFVGKTRGKTRLAESGPPAAPAAPRSTQVGEAPARAGQQSTRAGRPPPGKTPKGGSAKPSPLRIGSVVGNRYELVERLGAGGMGLVYKAKDRLRVEAQDRNPYVALKIMSERFQNHPDSMIALQREARRAQKLAHPNVITVHEFFRDGPHFYMTMELLQGTSLDVLLKTKYSEGVSMETAWPIIEGVGHALAYGHKKGIVHSDVKPGNIFVCADGTVKLLDLGISRPMPVGDGTQSDQTVFDPGKRLGSLTPGYAALEMWYQDTPDPRDDIYAFACVTYMLLAGRHPFGGKSSRDAKKQKLEPKRIESLARSQWAVLRKGLRFRRENRTSSVNRFVKGLAPDTVISSRRRTAGLVGGLVAILIVVAGIWYYGLIVEDRALGDRGRLGTARQAPVERPELSPEELAEMNDMVRLAEIQMGQLGRDSSADDYLYVLSGGPNNVADLLDTVLSTDPGFEVAVRLRQLAYELLLDKARQVRGGEPDKAMALAREADSLIANRSEVLRLQRLICSDAPQVCR